MARKSTGLPVGTPPQPLTDEIGVPGAVATMPLHMVTALDVLSVCHSKRPISCGLSLTWAGRAPETVAATDDLPLRVDWLQHHLQQGPDVSPAGGLVLVSRDLAADSRWPDFGRMSVAVLGVRSMVAVALPISEFRGSMNFYSSDPAAFDHFDVDGALRLAQCVAPAAAGLVPEILVAQEVDPDSDFSRATVALAIVMAQYKVGTSDGFDLLREAARDLKRPFFSVAADVVRDGRLPEVAIMQLRHLRRSRRLARHKSPPFLEIVRGTPPSPTAELPPPVTQRNQLRRLHRAVAPSRPSTARNPGGHLSAPRLA